MDDEARKSIVASHFNLLKEMGTKLSKKRIEEEGEQTLKEIKDEKTRELIRDEEQTRIDIAKEEGWYDGE